MKSKSHARARALAGTGVPSFVSSFKLIKLIGVVPTRARPSRDDRGRAHCATDTHAERDALDAGPFDEKTHMVEVRRDENERNERNGRWVGFACTRRQRVRAIRSRCGNQIRLGNS